MCSFLVQVHEEFKQNVENIRVQDLIQKYALTKGTGKEKPGIGSVFPEERRVMECVFLSRGVGGVCSPCLGGCSK